MDLVVLRLLHTAAFLYILYVALKHRNLVLLFLRLCC